MSDAVDNLDFYANHFYPRNWDYTRVHQLKKIRYDSSYDATETFRYRIQRAFRFIFGKAIMSTGFSPYWRVRMFFYALKRDKNLPDGILDGGNVITHWEETGEYLQMVQPSVGALLATFLKEEPENPHAKLIIAELERISDRYSERIKNKEVGNGEA